MKPNRIFVNLLNDLITKKLRLKSTPDFNEDYDIEAGSFNEEINLEINNSQYDISVEFEWSYKIEESLGNYMTPSSTEYLLDDIQVKFITLINNDNGETYDISLTHENLFGMIKYLATILPLEKLTLHFRTQLHKMKFQPTMIRKEQYMKKSQLKQLIKESVQKILKETIYSFEISLRDARLAQGIFRDQFDRYGKMSSTNVFDFSDFGTAIDFAETMTKNNIEIGGITEDGRDASDDFNEYIIGSMNEETGLTKKFDKVASAYKNLMYQKQEMVNAFTERMKILSPGPEKEAFKADYMKKITPLNIKIKTIEAEFEKSVRNMRDPDEDELL